MNTATETVRCEPRDDVYEGQVTICAPRARVFDAIATLEGLRGWWTPLVSGATSGGAELRFEFHGLDEQITMRVDHASRPSAVEWTCLIHTTAPEWNGTRVSFELDDAGGASMLTLRHSGLAPDAVARGWNYFLASIRGYVEDGEGTPYGETA
jgi:uncharacterized protein YndB with AHSA1/START domain